MSAFDAYIKQQLSVLESTFFPSLQGDVTELEGFNKSWTTFNALIASTEDLTDETRLLVASFAEIGETVASALLEVETASDHIYNQLENELARITEEALNGLSIQDTSPQGLRFVSSWKNQIYYFSMYSIPKLSSIHWIMFYMAFEEPSQPLSISGNPEENIHGN